MEKEQPKQEVKCLVCNSPGEGRVLVKVLKDGKDLYCCTRCLPVLIHGGH